MSTSSGNRNPVERLAEEFLDRKRRGEPATPEEYAGKHPELAAEILALFPALLVMEDLGGDPSGKSGSLSSGAGTASGKATGWLGEFQLLREVGRGGMGVVYEAEQQSLGRRVALKVLPAGALTDPKQVRRFEREARSAARLHHTNIVPVFGVGNNEGTHYYVMQFIQGQGLDAVLDELKQMRASRGAQLPVERTGPQVLHADRRETAADIARSLVTGRFAAGLPNGDPVAGSATLLWSGPPEIPTHGPSPSDSGLSRHSGGSGVSTFAETDRRFAQGVARIGVQVAEALAYAHGQGILHRDIKPSNLLLDKNGNVWVADFGLAKAIGADDLTHTGDIVGTVRYMAPERFQGQGDARADVYALGLTLYELLALRPAFGESDRASLIRQVTQEDPPRLRRLNRAVPLDLETIVHKAMAREPGQRYPTAAALAEDLNRFIAGEPIVARPVLLWERAWKWAKRRPAIAALIGALHLAFLALLAMGVVSYIQIHYALDRANDEKNRALVARADEAGARKRADLARQKADLSRNAALAETYRASLSEVRALRAGRPAGWRDDALGNLARLTTMPSPRRDLVELRTEAVASLGEFDIVEVAWLEGFRGTVGSLDFSPDSRALATATTSGDLHLWDVASRQHAWQVVDPAGTMSPSGFPSPAEPQPSVRFLPDGGLARTTWGHRVEFLDSSGRRSARPPIDGGTAQALRLEVDRQGRWLAVGWNDGRIDLHDAATGALRRSIAGNPYPWALALSPDGAWLALHGPNDAVQIQPTGWDGRPITLGRHRGADKLALAFSPDGTTLASAAGQSATLWDVARREERLTLRGHKEKVTDLAFSPDGNWVATTSDDYTTRIWDARSGQTLAVLPGPWFMHNVAFSPDSRYLAVSARTDTRTVTLYQLLGRRERRWLVGHEYGVQCLAFHPRLARLASGADDHAIIVWDAESAHPFRRWTAHTAWVTALAYSPDGSLLASGRGGGEDFRPPEILRLWDAETGSLRRVLSGHVAGVSALAFDPGGRRLATGDTSGILMIWDVTTGRILRRETVGPSWVGSIAFLDEGRRLVTDVADGPIVLYDLEGTEPPRRVSVPGGIARFVVDPARNDLIVAANSGSLSRVSLPGLAAGHRLDKAHDGKIESLALHPSGRLLATGGSDRRIILRDAATFEPLLSLPTWTGTVKDLAFDATGRWLAIAGADSDVGLWDLGLVRDELAALGLAWDQPAPAVARAADLAAVGERSQPEVPVIRPGNTDPAEFAKARDLVQSGVTAFEKRRLADAIRDLQQARDRLRPLFRAHPGDSRLASVLGISLGALGSALRDTHRPVEALASFQDARGILEPLLDPEPNDFYNLACVYAQLGWLIQDAATPATSSDRAALAERAIETLRRALAAGWSDFSGMDRDHDLDPLRGRADFQALILDRGFPVEPFAPSGLAVSARSRPAAGSTPSVAAATPGGYAGIGVTTHTDSEGALITDLARGGPAARDGRLHPGDTIIGVEQVVLFGDKSLNQISSYLRGEAGTKVRIVVRPKDTDRREVYEFTRALIATAPSPSPSPATAVTEALDQAIALRPEDPALRFERGGLLARRGAWKGALADFREGLARDPSDTQPWMDAATLYLELGDLEGYRRHARAMLDLFGATASPQIAERTAKIGLLTAPPPADRTRLTALAELAVTDGAGTTLIPWYQFARGMAAYRDGQFAPAADWLRAAHESISAIQFKIAIELFRAMAEARLGQNDSARARLDGARRALLESAPPAADLGAGWHDWLICQIALREAEALILYDPVFPADPFAR
ncbi:MAG: protein kinase domain-containing protein [Isosphaeraceae bacterium]